MAYAKTELKPCPFCGGEAAFYTGADNCVPRHATAFVYCKECRSATRLFTDVKNDGAFITAAGEAWNRRAE